MTQYIKERNNAIIRKIRRINSVSIPVAIRLYGHSCNANESSRDDCVIFSDDKLHSMMYLFRTSRAQARGTK